MSSDDKRANGCNFLPELAQQKLGCALIYRNTCNFIRISVHILFYSRTAATKLLTFAIFSNATKSNLVLLRT